MFQLDGTSQIMQVTEEQAEALCIAFTNDSVAINEPQNELTKTAVSEPAPKQIILTDAVVSNKQVSRNKSEKPLGSSENPIEIIKDGEILHSNQNLSADHLQQIVQALQFETSVTDENTSVSVPTENVIYRVVYPEELDLKVSNKYLLV